MDFSLTDDQVMIRDAAADFLQQSSDSEAVRAAMATDTGFDPNIWQSIAAELGWCGIAISEDQGGMGLGPVELVLLQEQAGFHLLCSPFFSSACLATPLLQQVANSDAQAQWLPKLALGEQQLSAPLPANRNAWNAPNVEAQEANGQWKLTGQVQQLPNADTADALLLFANAPDGLGLFCVTENAQGLSLQTQRGWDETRRFSIASLNSVIATRCDSGIEETALKRSIALSQLYLAAEAVGSAQRCLDLTLQYIADRKQFGRTIASFQAIKHRCALMMVKIEAARSALYGAAAVAASNAAIVDVATECASAKALANDALFDCAAEAIQLHGGVGFTQEYDPQLFFKRAQASKNWLGCPTQLRGQIADELLGAVA